MSSSAHSHPAARLGLAIGVSLVLLINSVFWDSVAWDSVAWLPAD